MAQELTIHGLRREIDQLDEELVRLLDRRARCAVAIGRLKQALGAPVYEPNREADVVARARAVNARLAGPLDDEAIRRLYERIIDEARRLQRVEPNAPRTGNTSALARPAEVEE